MALGFYGDWDNHLAMSEAEELSFMAPKKSPSFLLGSQGKLPTTAKGQNLEAGSLNPSLTLLCSIHERGLLSASVGSARLF